jgi:hypothetical protein
MLWQKRQRWEYIHIWGTGWGSIGALETESTKRDEVTRSKETSFVECMV